MGGTGSGGGVKRERFREGGRGRGDLKFIQEEGEEGNGGKWRFEGRRERRKTYGGVGKVRGTTR